MRLITIGIFLVISGLGNPSFSQLAEKDSLPVNTSIQSGLKAAGYGEQPHTAYNTIIAQGKRIPLDLESRNAINARVEELLSAFFRTLRLAPAGAQTPGDTTTIRQFLGLFPEELWDQPIIPNFTDPLSTSQPSYWSPMQHVDFVINNYDNIEEVFIDRPMHGDFMYEYPGNVFRRGNRYVMARNRVNFEGYLKEGHPSGMFVFSSNFQLNFLIAVSRESIRYASGVEVPIEFKIRFVEWAQAVELPEESLIRYRNTFAFLRPEVSLGQFHAQTQTNEETFNQLAVLPGVSKGAGLGFVLFLNDTTKFLEKTRLWSVGLHSGAYWNRHEFGFGLPEFAFAQTTNQSPRNGLTSLAPFSLEVSGADLMQNVSLDYLSIPLGISLMRYLSPRRLSVITLDLGASWNYLLQHRIVGTEGGIQYTGRGLRLVEGFDPLTIDDLPHYGFGLFNAAYDEGDHINPFSDMTFSGNARLGFQFKTDRMSASEWSVSAWTSLWFTSILKHDTASNPVGFLGNTGHLAEAMSVMKPWVAGVQVGWSYNIWKNKYRNVRIDN